MTYTWLIIVGNKDLLLKTDQNWRHNYRKIRLREFRNHAFYPEENVELEPGRLFEVPARALGSVYSLQPDKSEDISFVYDSLFSSVPNGVEEIVCVYTDQSSYYENHMKKSKSCLLWQDTWTLQPLLKRYFQEKFPEAEISDILLASDLRSYESAIKDVREKVINIINSTPSREVIITSQTDIPTLGMAVNSQLTLFKNKRKILLQYRGKSHFFSI